MSAMIWRLHDAMAEANGGCIICGDQDGFSPNVEAFERTGCLICGDCFDVLDDQALSELT